MGQLGYAPWTEEADLTMSENLSEKQIKSLAKNLKAMSDRKSQSDSQQQTTEQPME